MHRHVIVTKFHLPPNCPAVTPKEEKNNIETLRIDQVCTASRCSIFDALIREFCRQLISRNMF